jgi:hypothetical protein
MVPTEKITDERLALWRGRLSQMHATPAVLIGIGHDHQSGKLVVCTTTDMPDNILREMLMFALADLYPFKDAP